MFYYKKEKDEIVKYDVTVDKSKLYEHFGMWGRTLNPTTFTQVISLLNGDDSVIQELLDSEDMNGHNFSRCFSLEEIDRLTIDKYIRIINFFGLKNVPVKVNGIENAPFKDRDCYENSNGMYVRKNVKISLERIKEIVQHFYLRYGDKCPNIVGLLEALEEGDYSVVPEILIHVEDKVNETRLMESDKTSAIRDLRFLYQPVSRAIRTKEVVSITEDEYIAGTKFFDIDFPLDLVPVCPDQLLSPEYRELFGQGQEELIECMIGDVKEDPSKTGIQDVGTLPGETEDAANTVAAQDDNVLYEEQSDIEELDTDRLMEILNSLEVAKKFKVDSMISYWLGVLNRLPEESRMAFRRIQFLQDKILTARSQSNIMEETYWQDALNSFLESGKTKTM